MSRNSVEITVFC